MKNMRHMNKITIKYIILCAPAFLLLLTACKDQETSLYGTWQLTEVYISPGTREGEWVAVENGYTFDIQPDGTFYSSKYDKCSTGSYTISDQTISFMYNCQNFYPCNASSSTCIESFSFENQYLVLRPNYLDCIEGCSYKFSKTIQSIEQD